MNILHSIRELSNACDGEIIGNSSERRIDHLLTDSRKLTFPQSTLFFALVTERNNGHNFIKGLYDEGVRAFVVSEGDYTDLKGATFIKVKSTFDALHDVAAAKRASFQNPVIGITGSNGKTIVKEWIYQLVHQNYYVVRSPKSFNSKIGVPHSLWNLDSNHNLALIEAGISQEGDMQYLEDLIKPTWGIFTKIGDAHSEGFVDRASKISEKLLLFQHAEKIFYGRNQADLTNAIESSFDKDKLVSWSYSNQGTFNSISVIKENKQSDIKGIYKGEELFFTIPFVDNASVENALLSLLVSLELGVGSEKLANRAKHLYPIDLRLDITKGIKGTSIIRDFYNSDPESVQIALDFMMGLNNSGKHILVLSAFDQIRKIDDPYSEIVDRINQTPISKVYLVGEDWKPFLDSFNAEVDWFLNTKQLLEKVNQIIVRDALILFKGARKYKFETLANKLVAQLHTTFMEVNLGSLINNLNTYKSLLKKDTKVMAMVKAYSYGSGSAEIAAALEFNHVDYLGVAYLEEGVMLRKSGITLPIMVMNPEVSSFSKLIKYNLEPEIYDLNLLHAFEIALIKFNYKSQEYPIHLKIETGMQRLGFKPDEIDDMLFQLKEAGNMKVKTVFTHLAAADNESEDGFTKGQFDMFQRSALKIESELGYSFIKHALNSSGIVRFPDHQMDMVRLGLGMYGIDPTQNIKGLEAVATLVSRVSYVKTVEKGVSVGYNREFLTPQKMKVATLPIGYADGLFRSLGNENGSVWVKGKLCRIIGNVCMDLCMVDVTGLGVQVGDEVEIFGRHLSISEMAKNANTIPYEIMVRIGQRVPRVYVDN